MAHWSAVVRFTKSFHIFVEKRENFLQDHLGTRWRGDEKHTAALDLDGDLDPNGRDYTCANVAININLVK